MPATKQSASKAGPTPGFHYASANIFFSIFFNIFRKLVAKKMMGVVQLRYKDLVE